MRKALVLTVLLESLLAGCNMEAEPVSAMETTGCTSQVPPVPTVPDLRTVPDTGELPTLAASSHIVVTLFPLAGKYLAAGVDTSGQFFTFALVGNRTTLPALLDRFYATRAVVTVYSAPLMLTSKVMPPSTSPTPPPSATSTRGAMYSSDGGDEKEPCLTCIGDDTGGGDRNPGGEEAYQRFMRLVWHTANEESYLAVPWNRTPVGRTY
jgi:hypothetical protein